MLPISYLPINSDSERNKTAADRPTSDMMAGHKLCDARTGLQLRYGG